MEAAMYFTYKSGIAFFPILGYLFQYRLIHRRQQIGTFSIKVCGILLLSATLKIAFYLFKYYSKALLAQALLMIAVQLSLLRLCLNVMHKEGHFTDEQGQEVKKESFWRWSNRLNYVYTIAFAAVCIFGLALLVRTYKLTLLGEILGYGATCIETTILLPQLLQNLKQSKVKGVSYTFVLLNTAQDLNQFMFVFVVEPQPMQFVVLNGVQTMADVLLILQIVFYKVWRKVVEELVEEGEGEEQRGKEQHRKEQHGEGKDREGGVGMESQDIIIDKRALQEEIKAESECRGEEQDDEGYSSQQRLEIQPEPACSKREESQKEQQQQQQEKYQFRDVGREEVQQCRGEGTEERELGQEQSPFQGDMELASGEENKVASTVDDQE